MLLSRRRSDQSFPRTWEFPGGKVEPGETLEAALVREILEELGCRVKVGQVVDIIFHAYPEFDLVMPVFTAKLGARAPRAVEVDAIAWVPLSDLTSLPMPPADVPFAKRLARIPAQRRGRETCERLCCRLSKPSRRS